MAEPHGALDYAHIKCLLAVPTEKEGLAEDRKWRVPHPDERALQDLPLSQDEIEKLLERANSQSQTSQTVQRSPKAEKATERK